MSAPQPQPSGGGHGHSHSHSHGHSHTHQHRGFHDADEDMAGYGYQDRADDGAMARNNAGLSDDAMEEERKHYYEVALSFHEYAIAMQPEVRRRERHVARLPPRYQRLL